MNGILRTLQKSNWLRINQIPTINILAQRQTMRLLSRKQREQSSMYLDLFRDPLKVPLNHLHSFRCDLFKITVHLAQGRKIVHIIQSDFLPTELHWWRCSAAKVENLYLLVLLLAPVSCRPQPPGIIVNHVCEDNLFGGDVDTKLDLIRYSLNKA